MDDNSENVPGDGAIDQAIQEKLGEKLKDAYADIISEPVPDRFIELLNQLSENEKQVGTHETPGGAGDKDGEQ